MTEVMDYAPAKVHIVADDTRVYDRAFRNVTSKTYLAGNVPECILPRSQGRRVAHICVLGIAGTDGRVILADNEADAGYGPVSLGGQTCGGAVIQPGIQFDISHNDEVWLARYTATGNAPLVSVIAEYDAG